MKTTRQAMDGDGGEQANERNPAEVIDARNNSRIQRMQEIANRVDGSRADDMGDIEDTTVTGRFQGGEFDDSPEAREARALQEEEDARQVLEDEAARAQAAELQGEGAAPEPAQASGEADSGGDAAEERIVDGVRQYLLVTPEGEKWLTWPQMKALAQKTAAADEALRLANEAVRNSTRLDLSPREVPSDRPPRKDKGQMVQIVSAAVMGDQKAIDELTDLLLAVPSETPDVSREVAQTLATQRAVEQAEKDQADIFGVEALVPVFRARLRQVAQDEPNLSIPAAYKKAGDKVRQEFAPMLKEPTREPSKLERKQLMARPLRAASRQASRAEEDGEENPTSVIDSIAKSRGQNRAIRHGRNI